MTMVGEGVGEVSAEQGSATVGETGEPMAATESGNGLPAAAEPGSLSYADFKVPEGVSLNPELLAEFAGIAKGFGLQQEQAQALTDLGVKLSGQLQAKHGAEQSALQEAFNVGEGAVKSAEFVRPQALSAQVSQWEAAVKADAELGGDKLAENLAVAVKARDALGSPALLELLNKSGLGSHPELIRAFFKAGQLLAEDSLVSGGVKPAAVAVGRTPFEQAANRLFG